MFARTFRRVLPLPSDLWGEFGGSVFCHYHGHGHAEKEERHQPDGGIPCVREGVASPVTSNEGCGLVPRVGDCLTGDDRLLVNEECLNLANIHEVCMIQ